MKSYTVIYTDPGTGAKSEIDTITEADGYTAADYIRDCDENAAPEWCDMLRRGTVELEEIATE